MLKTKATVRLRFDRETLKPLCGETLEQVAGGTPFPISTTCPPGQHSVPGGLTDVLTREAPKPVPGKLTDILTGGPLPPQGTCFCPTGGR